jgi:hypothetical protein
MYINVNIYLPPAIRMFHVEHFANSSHLLASRNPGGFDLKTLGGFDLKTLPFPWGIAVKKFRGDVV